MKRNHSRHPASRQFGVTSARRLFVVALVVAFAAGGALGYSARGAWSPGAEPIAMTTEPAQTATAAWPMSNGDPSLPSAAQALQGHKGGSSDDSGEAAPTF